MLPYIFIFSYFACIYFLSFLISDRKVKKLLLVFSSIVLAIFSGLRLDVGVDFQNYISLFNQLYSGDLHVHTEAGFNYFVILMGMMGASHHLIFLIFSILTILFFYKYINYFSSFKLISLFIFFSFSIFYLASFNQIRQFLAVAIFAYSLRFIVEKRFFLYLLHLVLAGLFHKSAFLMIPLYIVLGVKPNLFFYIIISLFFLIVLKISDFIIIKFLGFSPVYLLMGGGDGSLLLPLLFFVFMVLAFLFKLPEKYNIFINLNFFAVLILLTPFLSYYPLDMIYRVSSFFTLSLIILIPALGERLVLNSRVLYFLLTFLFFTYHFFRVLIQNGSVYKLVPYSIIVF